MKKVLFIVGLIVLGGFFLVLRSGRSKYPSGCCPRCGRELVGDKYETYKSCPKHGLYIP